MFCGHCGAKNSEESVFCGQCGQVLRKAHETSLPSRSESRSYIWIFICIIVLTVGFISVKIGLYQKKQPKEDNLKTELVNEEEDGKKEKIVNEEKALNEEEEKIVDYAEELSIDEMSEIERLGDMICDTDQVIRAAGANVREKPSSEADNVDGVKKGQVVHITKIYAEKVDLVWCYARYEKDGQSHLGWISYNTMNGNILPDEEANLENVLIEDVSLEARQEAQFYLGEEHIKGFIGRGIDEIRNLLAGGTYYISGYKVFKHRNFTWIILNDSAHDLSVVKIRPITFLFYKDQLESVILSRDFGWHSEGQRLMGSWKSEKESRGSNFVQIQKERLIGGQISYPVKVDVDIYSFEKDYFYQKGIFVNIDSSLNDEEYPYFETIIGKNKESVDNIKKIFVNFTTLSHE